LQKLKNTRNVRAKELNEYSYVINSWYIKDGKIIDFPDDNIFLNDYLNASSKERPPKLLIYYFEDKEMKFAYKLKIVLGSTTSPQTVLSYLRSDKLGCNEEQFSNEDFRRQSCYVFSRIIDLRKNSSQVSVLKTKILRAIDKSR